MTDEEFVASEVTGLGFMASVYEGVEAIPGKTGGEFNMIVEKVELI